jgi:hypothetical protein
VRGIFSRLDAGKSLSDIEGLIRDSMHSYRTTIYDWIQENSNNILM